MRVCWFRELLMYSGWRMINSAADYKTDRVNAAKELIDRYSTQLKLYADALGRIFSTDGKSIQADERLIYSFRLQQTIVTCREYKK